MIINKLIQLSFIAFLVFFVSTSLTAKSATKGFTFTDAWLKYNRVNDASCDCKYRYKAFLTPGGCQIIKPSRAGTACHCGYSLWRCSGTAVLCKDEKSDSCKNPSTDKASCDEGQGDCGGY